MPLSSLGGGGPPPSRLPSTQLATAPICHSLYPPSSAPARTPWRNWEAWSFARNRPRRNQRSLLKQLRGETYCCWGWGGVGGWGWGSGLQDCRGRRFFYGVTNEDAHRGKLIPISNDYITSFWVVLSFKFCFTLGKKTRSPRRAEPLRGAGESRLADQNQGVAPRPPGSAPAGHCAASALALVTAPNHEGTLPAFN